MHVLLSSFNSRKLIYQILVFLLQSEIMSKPELFVEPDPELPLALLDQKEVCNNFFFFV